MIEIRVTEIQEPSLKSLVGQSTKIFTTLEGENPGGSIKDHMVSGALRKMLDQGTLTGEKILTEASAGSTAKSLAFYCNELKVKCVLFVPETLSIDKQNALRSYGAEVRAVPMNHAWEIYGDFCGKPDVVPFNQHTDIGKRAYYHGLGASLSLAIPSIDCVIGSIGTSHSLIGTTEGIRPRPFISSAEPHSIDVSGIRNIDRVKLEKNDPCSAELFNTRTILGPSEFFHNDTLETSLGKIEFSQSFQVVLGALLKLARTRTMKTVFLLGADNRRLKFAGELPK